MLMEETLIMCTKIIWKPLHHERDFFFVLGVLGAENVVFSYLVELFFMTYPQSICLRKSIQEQEQFHNVLGVTNSYLVLLEFSTSQKELLLVSSRSISSLISGGDSSYSWVQCSGPIMNERSARL